VERVRTSAQAPDEFDSPEQAFQMLRAANPCPSEEMLWLRVGNNLKRLADGRWTWKYDKALRDPDRAVSAALPREEMWHLLSRVACPTLIVRGEESDILAADVAQRMAQVMPQATLVTIAEAGHAVPADNPQAFAAAVRRFLGK